MVLKLPSRCRKRNHLARRRIDLVCSVVESLLRHYGTASIVDGSVFSFDAAAEAEAAEAEKTSSSSPSSENRSPPPPPPPPSDLQQLNRGDSGVNSNNNTNDSSRTTTIGTHCTENGRTEGLLVDLLCAHLFAALKNHYHHHHHHHHQSNLLIIIIVVAEGELARLQTALEGWKTKELESEGVKWRRVRIRLIKVAGVGGDTEEKLPQNKSTEEKEEEEEDENEQTIEATAQALHLLSRPLHSPITRASIPDTTRAEAAFLQYNIARINSILDKYSSSIKSGGDYISDDQSTTTTTISPDCTKVVPEAAAASAASASANLKSLTADDDEWHLVLLYWLPLAQLADELYSQLLLMETETTMTGDSADINDQQEENHAKTVMVTSAEAVAVDVCCPVLDVHKVSRLLARLAHGFSVYYRKVKILRLQLPPSAEESSEEEASETNAATATDAKTKTAAATDHHYHHLLQLMAARVRLCALIRQQLLFYLCSLLGIAAVQKM